jgi:hypothetical protein
MHYLAIFLTLITISSTQINPSNYPGEDTFYPLIPGSYWIWVDSYINDEAYQIAYEMTDGMSVIGITKDSVISLKKSKNNYTAIIKSVFGYKENTTRNTIFDTIQCDSIGRISNEYNERLALLYPKQGDTLKTKQKVLVRGRFKIDTTTCFKCFENQPNKFSETSYICKGVGKVRMDQGTTISILEEYRIGNGPVIKKHWLMESPEKK